MATGLKKKRRIQLIAISFVLLALATVLVGVAFKDGIEFFRSPTQVHEEAIDPREVFRIGGLVKDDSLKKQGERVDFVVTDGANEVAVRFKGILPDLFDEGQGMIATGVYDGLVFEAQEILAKHDENYLPKEVADALKEQGVFKQDAAETNQ